MINMISTLTLLNSPIFFLTSFGILSVERALISVPQLQIICYEVVGGKMALALAAEKNKHCCHTPRVMFCGWAFCAG